MNNVTTSFASELRNARILAAKDDFLITRFVGNKPSNLKKALMKQYRDLLTRDRNSLMQNLIWCYDGKSLEVITGTDGSIPTRTEEVFRLGGVSKQAIAYFIVKKQFESYDFLNSD